MLYILVLYQWYMLHSFVQKCRNAIYKVHSVLTILVPFHFIATSWPEWPSKFPRSVSCCKKLRIRTKDQRVLFVQRGLENPFLYQLCFSNNCASPQKPGMVLIIFLILLVLPIALLLTAFEALRASPPHVSPTLFGATGCRNIPGAFSAGSTSSRCRGRGPNREVLPLIDPRLNPETRDSDGF